MIQVREIYVKIAEVKKGEGDVLLKITLGSCVAIIFYDRKKKVSAAAHCLLPEGEISSSDVTARYVQTGIKALKNLLNVEENTKSSIDVSLVGGANMMGEVFKVESAQVGMKNSQVAIELLEAEGFDIKFKDIGGECARQVVVWSQSGKLEITTLNKNLLKAGKL